MGPAKYIMLVYDYVSTYFINPIKRTSQSP